MAAIRWPGLTVWLQFRNKQTNTGINVADTNELFVAEWGERRFAARVFFFFSGTQPRKMIREKVKQLGDEWGEEGGGGKMVCKFWTSSLCFCAAAAVCICVALDHKRFQLFHYVNLGVYLRFLRRCGDW